MCTKDICPCYSGVDNEIKEMWTSYGKDLYAPFGRNINEKGYREQYTFPDGRKIST